MADHGGDLGVGPGEYCSPRHPTHFKPSSPESASHLPHHQPPPSHSVPRTHSPSSPPLLPGLTMMRRPVLTSAEDVTAVPLQAVWHPVTSNIRRPCLEVAVLALEGPVELVDILPPAPRHVRAVGEQRGQRGGQRRLLRHAQHNGRHCRAWFMCSAPADSLLPTECPTGCPRLSVPSRTVGGLHDPAIGVPVSLMPCSRRTTVLPDAARALD